MRYHVWQPAKVAIRAAGAASAAALSALALGVMPWLTIGTVAVGPLGIGVAALLGFAYGPTAVTTSRPWWFAFGLAVQAVLFGELFIVGLGLVQAIATGVGGVESLVSVVLIVPYGFVLMLPVTVPVGLLTTAVLRLAAQASPVRGVLLLASVVAVTGTAGLATLASPPADSSSITEPVRLTWTVENHSGRDLELGIWQGDLSAITTGAEASWGGLTQRAEACFVSTGHGHVARDWFLSLGTPIDDSVEEANPRPSPLIEASQLPGDTPSVRFVVATDGVATVVPRAEPPSDADLVVNLCREALP